MVKDEAPGGLRGGRGAPTLPEGVNVGVYGGFSNLLLADGGGGRTAWRDWMGVQLAGRQRSSECPQHSPQTHQWPSTQFCKKRHSNVVFVYALFHRGKRSEVIFFNLRVEPGSLKQLQGVAE